MVEKPVAQHASKSRRVIDILVLLVIVLGIILVLAELVINVLPEIKAKSSVSAASQSQGITALDRHFTRPVPTEASANIETQ